MALALGDGVEAMLLCCNIHVCMCVYVSRKHMSTFLLFVYLFVVIVIGCCCCYGCIYIVYPKLGNYINFNFVCFFGNWGMVQSSEMFCYLYNLVYFSPINYTIYYTLTLRS